jgi:hypothetical protein
VHKFCVPELVPRGQKLPGGHIVPMDDTPVPEQKYPGVHGSGADEPAGQNDPDGH